MWLIPRCLIYTSELSNSLGVLGWVICLLPKCKYLETDLLLSLMNTLRKLIFGLRLGGRSFIFKTPIWIEGVLWVSTQVTVTRKAHVSLWCFGSGWQMREVGLLSDPWGTTIAFGWRRKKCQKEESEEKWELVQEESISIHRKGENPHTQVPCHPHRFQSCVSTRKEKKVENTQEEEERTAEAVAFLLSENWVKDKRTNAWAQRCPAGSHPRGLPVV